MSNSERIELSLPEAVQFWRLFHETFDETWEGCNKGKYAYVIEGIIARFAHHLAEIEDVGGEVVYVPVSLFYLANIELP